MTRPGRGHLRPIRLSAGPSGATKEIVRRVVRQQRLDLAMQLLVARTGVEQQRVAVGLSRSQRLVIHLEDPLPTVGRHGKATGTALILWHRRPDIVASQKHEMSEGTGAVSQLLHAWAGGDVRARDELVPLVYQELRKRAAGYLRHERVDHTLQATALVHEAFMRWPARTVSPGRTGATSTPSPRRRCGAFWWTTRASVEPRSARIR